jgi:hypothetical protein
VRFSIETPRDNMFQTFSTIMWLPILECTTVATGFHLARGLRPFWKEFLRGKEFS